MDMSGIWVGQYRYGAGIVDLKGNMLDEVPFTAHISDRGGAFLGEVEEEGAPASTLRGQREGSTVTFSKRYSDSGGGRFIERVIYEGLLNEDGTRIDGEWSIHKPHAISGAFFMMREPPLKADAEHEAELELET